MYADAIFRCNFVNEKFSILVTISLKFDPKGLVDNRAVNPVHWRIYMALGGDELIQLWFAISSIQTPSWYDVTKLSSGMDHFWSILATPHMLNSFVKANIYIICIFDCSSWSWFSSNTRTCPQYPAFWWPANSRNQGINWLNSLRKFRPGVYVLKILKAFDFSCGYSD